MAFYPHISFLASWPPKVKQSIFTAGAGNALQAAVASIVAGLKRINTWVPPGNEGLLGTVGIGHHTLLGYFWLIQFWDTLLVIGPCCRFFVYLFIHGCSGLFGKMNLPRQEGGWWSVMKLTLKVRLPLDEVPNFIEDPAGYDPWLQICVCEWHCWRCFPDRIWSMLELPASWDFLDCLDVLCCFFIFSICHTRRGFIGSSSARHLSYSTPHKKKKTTRQCWGASLQSLAVRTPTRTAKDTAGHRGPLERKTKRCTKRDYERLYAPGGMQRRFWLVCYLTILF